LDLNAIALNEGVGLIVEVDPERAQRRRDADYVDVVVHSLDEALGMVRAAQAQGEPQSIGVIANAADVFPELVRRGITPDVVTDQTPAHEVLMYVPHGLALEAAIHLRRENPTEYTRRGMASMARHVEAMLEFQRRGAEVFDYGNNLRQRAFDAGVRQTRAASVQQLVDETRARLQRMLEHETTTVEVKTGYGLGTAAELRQWTALSRLQTEGPWDLVPTFLGTHASAAT
jgi:urocanate hydratase